MAQQPTSAQIAQAMTQPMRNQIAYNRKAILTEYALPQGALPLINKGYYGSAWLGIPVCFLGNAGIAQPAASDVDNHCPPTIEIAVRARMPFSVIKASRFNAISHMQQQLQTSFERAYDQHIEALLSFGCGKVVSLVRTDLTILADDDPANLQMGFIMWKECAMIGFDSTLSRFLEEVKKYHGGNYGSEINFSNAPSIR